MSARQLSELREDLAALVSEDRSGRAFDGAAAALARQVLRLLEVDGTTQALTDHAFQPDPEDEAEDAPCRFCADERGWTTLRDDHASGPGWDDVAGWVDAPTSIAAVEGTMGDATRLVATTVGGKVLRLTRFPSVVSAGLVRWNLADGLPAGVSTASGRALEVEGDIIRA